MAEGTNFSLYNDPFGSQLTGYGFGAPSVADTFLGSPEALYQTARLGAMGAQAALPQFQRTAMQGFQPAFGNYLLAGAPGGATFSDYLGSGMSSQAPTFGNWQDAISASAAIDPTMTLDSPLSGRALALQGLMQGENARRNMLAMAGSALGGGVGLGAQARERALGNIYDLYSARAAGAGQPTGTFLSWLANRVNVPTNTLGVDPTATSLITQA